MIVDRLNNWKKYFSNPVWETVFAELTALNETTPDMVKKIRGDDIVLKVFTYTTLDQRDEQLYPESHRHYLDIHACLVNHEQIIWYPASSLTVIRPYQETEDEIGYAKPQTAPARLFMAPGLFVLFGPDDAHMPRLRVSGQSEPVKKAVMKVHAGILF